MHDDKEPANSGSEAGRNPEDAEHPGRTFEDAPDDGQPENPDPDATHQDLPSARRRPPG